FGDNVVLDRTTTFGNHTSPRFRLLSGSTIYSTALLTAGQALVTAASQNDPAGPTAWSDFRITLLDHDTATQSLNDNRFGSDYIAGGAGDDTIFGQLGDDVIQGDGSIDGAGVAAGRDAAGTLVVIPSVSAAGDGDDYIEGGGGRDVVFGGLGRDDIIGGSSDLYSLVTMTQRPDVGDLLFGGSGQNAGRNDQTALHGRDSDTIVGDNGQVLRVVVGGANTAYPFFTYDTYAESVRLLPRAVVLLDYSPGGPDLNPARFPGMTQAASAGSGTGTVDVWGSDEVHGEAGDDTVYTGGGNDVVFGDAGDDDVIGGWGHDWISGGSGTDGVIGDDGRIFTSRNGLTELLNGVTSPNLQAEITTPGRLQVAVIFAAGALNKAVDITPFALDGRFDNPLFRPLYANDAIFGGLGDDFLHGASGDDAISGAEALATSWAATYAGASTVGVVETGWNRPFNDGTLLGFDPVRGDFILYDEYDPRRTILLTPTGALSKSGSGLAWFLGHDATERSNGTTGTASDGDDAIFGAHGNDWLVGGTGRDTLWGGWGNDLLDADDLKTTHGGLNDTADTDSTYEDRAYGGAGLDVLIANTGGDRLIDWVGEFNSYLVPFAPFGAATVSRTVQPQMFEFLYRLSRAQGADATLSQQTGAGSEARNGEPFGEAAVVTQKDDAWQDQTGGPRDPQAGNIHGGKRDVLRSADFNSSATLDGFFVDSGAWDVQGGALSVAAASLGKDAAAVFYIDDYLPIYYEILASIQAQKPTGGWKANAFVIFDYFSPTDFKFAGVDVSINKLVLGHRTASGWVYDTQTPRNLRAGTYLNLLVAVNGTTVTVQVDGVAALTYTYAPRMLDGVAYGLNKGMVGVGSDNARGVFDNIAVRILPPEVTLDHSMDLTSNTSGVTDRTSGSWAASSGGLTGSASAGQVALALASVPDPQTGQYAGARVTSTAWLELTARFTTAGMAGIAFDVYDAATLKMAVLDVPGKRILLGHTSARTGWVVDAVVPWALVAGAAHTLVLTLKGASASIQVDGSFVLSWGYNAGVVDGRFGLYTRGSVATFSSLRMRSDDPAYLVTAPTGDAGTAPPTSARTVSIGDASVSEGRSGSTQLVVPVTLSEASTDSVTVDVSISGGTATQGTDYDTWNPAKRKVVFAPGQTTAEVRITVRGDRTAEPDESVMLVLSGPAGAGLGRAVGRATILDDDSRLVASAVGPGTTAADRLVAPNARIVDAALRAAREQWLATGASPAVLHGVTVVFDEMGGADLAQTVGRSIRLDVDAAGWGWLLPGDAHRGTVDLVSVLLHELGHVLGHGHDDGGVMEPVLDPASLLSLLSVDAVPPPGARTSPSLVDGSHDSWTGSVGFHHAAVASSRAGSVPHGQGRIEGSDAFGAPGRSRVAVTGVAPLLLLQRAYGPGSAALGQFVLAAPLSSSGSSGGPVAGALGSVDVLEARGGVVAGSASLLGRLGLLLLLLCLARLGVRGSRRRVRGGGMVAG
ncbi:MAG: Calx-beta domain-containing protein, partial [Ornithinibacter sp.]